MEQVTFLEAGSGLFGRRSPEVVMAPGEEHAPFQTDTEPSGAEREALQQALLSAFPTDAELEQFVNHKLEINLNSFAPAALGLEERTQRLIVRAVARGFYDKLVDEAFLARPDNPKMKGFYQKFDARRKERKEGRPGPSGAGDPDRGADNFSTGLEEARAGTGQTWQDLLHRVEQWREELHMWRVLYEEFRTVSRTVFAVRRHVYPDDLKRTWHHLQEDWQDECSRLLSGDLPRIRLPDGPIKEQFTKGKPREWIEDMKKTAEQIDQMIMDEVIKPAAESGGQEETLLEGILPEVVHSLVRLEGGCVRLVRFVDRWHTEAARELKQAVQECRTRVVSA
jgi:hypothetical protein